MGHTVSTEEFKEPRASSLSFPLINNMVNWPSCSAMHVTTTHSAKQHHEPDFPLATVHKSFPAFDHQEEVSDFL